MNEYCFIIDLYNKYQDNSNVIDIFTLQMGDYLQKWCIRQVPIEKYRWGMPQPSSWPQQDFELDYSIQHAYSTLEEAREFVKDLKRRNGI